MRIFVAGHRGMVGSAILRRLEDEGGHELLTRTSSELDLTNQQAVRDFMQTEKPEAVIDHRCLRQRRIAELLFRFPLRSAVLMSCRLTHAQAP